MIRWMDLAVLLLSQMLEASESGCIEMRDGMGGMFCGVPFPQEKCLLSRSDAD